jgi:hypothetical protein
MVGARKIDGKILAAHYALTGLNPTKNGIVQYD